MSRAMIELHNVSKRFGAVEAVRGVDLTIAEGEIVTLLGPSGSGKTTLLRMIAGFELPDKGRIVLDGKDVTHAPPYERDVRLVFQSYALFPHLTVEQNVEFGLKMMGVSASERRERVKDAISLVRIEGKEKARPHELSGGQKQRVALARALVCKPKVLLLDEPLSALDAKLRDAMQVELKKLQQKVGITFVFVTHDQQSALVVSDRIAVVNEGRIEQYAGVAEIYHRPKTAFVASFLGESNLLTARVLSRGDGKVRLSLAAGIEVIANDDGSRQYGSQVTVAIRPEKIHVEIFEFEMDGTFHGQVTDEIFRGPLAQLSIITESGLELTAVVATRTADRDTPSKGEQVTWWVHRDDVVIVG
ncbi:MAG: ABC transporter ATP-binding protein [Polyangiaceae bacterium]|nr:ABC transporter ATP-binding protein [Polyangiaceae bacterium]